MKKQILLYTMITLTIQGLSAFDNRKFFNIKTEEAQKSEVSQWAFIEQTFMIDAYTQKQVIWDHIYTSLPAAFALFAGYKYWNLPKKSNTSESNKDNIIYHLKLDGFSSGSITTPKDTKNKDFIKDLLNTENLYIIGGTIATTMCASKALNYYLNYHCNRQVVKNFLKNWDLNRSFTPREFHNMFDALANLIDINGDEAVLVHANEIVNIMQSIVMRHFEKRYETILTVQTFNHLGETKAMLDVIKTAIDTAKTLS